MAEPLTHEHFLPHLHKSFRFEGASLRLRLDEIDVKERPPLPHLPYKAFTLFFQGPRGEVLPEGLYVAEAEGGPRFELYIIPVHTVARDRQDYQVVFN